MGIAARRQVPGPAAAAAITLVRSPGAVVAADSDFEIRLRQKGVLAEAGFQVIEAGTRETTMNSARDGAAAVVVLSGLSDADVLTVCRELKECAETRDVPVLILSGGAAGPEYADALKAGADAWLVEPVTHAVLLRTIDSLLARRRVAGAREWMRFADSMPAILGRFRDDGTCEACNRAAYERTGMPPGSLEGNNWREVIHPEDSERVLEEWTEGVKNGVRFEIEYRQRCADREYRWFRTHITPMADGHVEGGAWVGCSVEIEKADSQLLEQAQQSKEESFRSLFENATVGIYRTTPDGRILMANPALVAMLGFDSFEELAKRNLETETFEPGYSRAEFRRRIEAEGVIKGLETTWTRRDGTAIFIRESTRVVRDSDGTVLYYDGIIEDFTRRKQIEDALRENEARLRDLVDSSPVITWVTGPDKKLEFMSREAVESFGLPMEMMAGDSWMEFLHPDDRAKYVATFFEAGEHTSAFSGQARFRDKNGGYRWLLIAGVPRIVDGCYQGHIGTAVDISELKRAFEQQLANEKVESLAILTAGIAHDFNNLLGTIVSRAESAQFELAPDSPAADDIRQINLTALRAAEIVAQLMTYGRRENAPLTEIQLSRLVREMADLVSVSVSKAATFNIDLPEDLPAIRGNAAELRQVIMNLILNASQALGSKPGTITIGTRLVSCIAGSGSGVCLEVIDNGCGMTEEVKNRIFDPFFTTRSGGRGLGLSAIQGIVRRHGATIDVESAPGAGSRFTLLFPCAG